MDLSEDEIAKLQKLVKYADQIEAEMEYKTARRLVMKAWRGGVIGLGGLLGAGLVIWVNFKAFIAWAAGGG